MKKVLFVVAAVAMMAGAVSCNKDCTCKGKVMGIEWKATYTEQQLKDMGTSCKELKDVLKDVDGIKCR